MLPGFRFLFAAILLSTSMLVFALGAAALLRTTHEQFANNPSWRTGPQEQVFAQATEPAQPVLAALRLEPVASEPEPSLRDDIPTIALPVNDVAQATALRPEAATEASAPEADARQPEPPSSALTPQDLAIAAATDSPAPAAPTVPVEATAVSATPAASEPRQSEAPPTSPVADSGTAKLAALSDATVASNAPPATAKVTSAAPEKATRKRAQRPKKKRRIVRRPPSPPAQQTYDPFATQPAFATTTAATRSR